MVLKPCVFGCECGALETVKEWLEDKADAWITISDNPPLCEATIKTKFEMIKKFIHEVSLPGAMIRKSVEVVGDFFQHKVSLSPAMMGEHLKIVSDYLQHQDSSFLAMIRVNLEICDHFLQYGNCPNVEDDVGFTPLLSVVQYGGSLLMLRLLLQSGADIMKSDLSDMSPLHIAVFSQDLQIINELLQQGAYVDEANISLCTPLHLATANGNKLVDIQIVQSLLQYRAGVNHINIHGKTPLHQAVTRERNIGSVRELLRYGAFVHVTDHDGNTPFDYAVGIVVMELLIKYALLQGFEGNYVELFNSKRHNELKDNKILTCYFEDCVYEVVRMKKTKINARVSLYKLVTAEINVALYPNNEALRNIAGEAVIFNYPIYNDVISSKVMIASERATLISKYICMQASVLKENHEKKKVVLNYDCISLITQFLSNEDMNNFILTFPNSSKNINRFPISSNDSNVLLKKENPETGFEKPEHLYSKKARFG